MPTSPRHAGDLDTITFSTNSYTFPGTFSSDLLTLTGSESIIGRAIVLHELADSCTGASGDAGARLAQCVIGVANPSTDTQMAVYQGGEASWAVAKVSETSVGGATVTGNVWFHLLSAGGGMVRTYVRLTTSDTTPASRGIHVHAYGDIQETNGNGMAGHYNPTGADHDLPPLTPRHMGDMGNVMSDSSGNIIATKDLQLLDLGNTMTNIIGRGLMVHALVDDGGQPTGNAGTRYAMGPIGLSAGPPATVVARIRGTSNQPNAAGSITITTSGGIGSDVTISGTVTGLAANTNHAFHIHTYGDATAADGTSADGHFNPDNVAHACWPTTPRHAGDIVNIMTDGAGSYTFPADFTRDLIDLAGSRSIVGRSIVIHAGADDCTGTSGNAGARVAQGILGISSPGSSLMINAAVAGVAVDDRAIAKLYTLANPQVATGTLLLTQNGDDLVITGTIDGLAANSVHGIHVHEWGDIRDDLGSGLGGHYNPISGTPATGAANPHGLPGTSPRHMGDLGNFKVSADGVARIHIRVPNRSLRGIDSVIGRGLVVHDMEDTGVQPTGGAGTKVVAGVIGVANTATDVPGTVTKATCRFVPAGDNDVAGTVTLTQRWPGANVVLSGTISNIPDGDHALHVHTYGNVLSPTGTGAGGHWNPDGTAHGCFPSTTRHAGDIGTITFSGSSYTFPAEFSRDLLELSGPKSIIGRSLVLHAAGDSCTGASGDAGARLAQCTIGIDAPAIPGTTMVTNSATYESSAHSAPWAVASISPVSGASPVTSGTVWFTPLPAPSSRVRVIARLGSNLESERTHAVHVHTYGNTNPDGTGVGGHYNPEGVAHALPMGPRHMGDMGNWDTSSLGTISFAKDLDLLNLGADPLANIIGRSVVVHAGADDGGQPTGNAGSKVAIGAIGLSSYPPAKAVVKIQGLGANAGISGVVTFDQPSGPGSVVTISGTLSGFSGPGEHAFHVHTFGAPSADGTAAGGHFNPDGADHGCYPAVPRHAGDIGTITVGDDGTYTFPADFTRDLLDLSGPKSIIGRSIVIHALADDCMGASGNAGSRIAFGVIGVATTPATDLYIASAESMTTVKGVASLQSIADPVNGALSGSVFFEQAGSDLTVTGRIYGLAPNALHAMHVHEFGDLSSDTNAGGAVGGHYAPFGNPHGLPPATMRHYGDLGTIMVGANGVAEFTKTFADRSLTGMFSFGGRALILHAGNDTGVQPTGAAGSKIAVGVIGLCETCSVDDVTPVSNGNGQLGGSSDKSSKGGTIAAAVIVTVLIVAAIAVGAVWFIKSKGAGNVNGNVKKDAEVALEDKLDAVGELVDGVVEDDAAALV